MHSKSISKPQRAKSQQTAFKPSKINSKLTRGIKNSKSRHNPFSSAYQKTSPTQSITTSQHFATPTLSQISTPSSQTSTTALNPVSVLLSFTSPRNFSTSSIKSAKFGKHFSHSTSLLPALFVPSRSFASHKHQERVSRGTARFFNIPQEPEPIKEYTSGDEVDDSEEHHNKQLVKEGKYGLPPEKPTIIKPPRLPKLNKINNIQRRFDLASHYHDLTPAERLELSSITCDFNITARDKEEYRLDHEEWQEIFDKFKLTHRSFDIDESRVETIEEARELLKKGFKVIRLDYRQLENWYEANKDAPGYQHFGEATIKKNYPKPGGPNYAHGDEDISEDDPNVPESDSDDVAVADAEHASLRGYSHIDDAEPAPLSLQDYKHILQRLYGQPAHGNPELLYIPGIKVLFRQEEYPVDKNGNWLPINYETHHLHDPYDYFHPDSSTVFDVPYNPIEDFDDFRRRSAYHMMTAEESLMNVRQSITCPVELHAFDCVMTSNIAPEFYSSYLSQDDSGKPYSDRHWFLETLNHPDPEQRYIPTTDDHDEWTDLFFYDFVNAPAKTRWKVAGAFTTMFGFAAILGIQGIMACDQYYYDIIHPLHH